MIAGLPVSPAEKAEAVRRLLAGAGKGQAMRIERQGTAKARQGRQGDRDGSQGRLGRRTP
jgi:hypothetical protein